MAVLCARTYMVGGAQSRVHYGGNLLSNVCEFSGAQKYHMFLCKFSFLFVLKKSGWGLV